jgi:hypothetical protein
MARFLTRSVLGTTKSYDTRQNKKEASTAIPRGVEGKTCRVNASTSQTKQP